ncbi:CHAT domain-containing protein [Coleofasciculus sp. FACHB-T130]|uniref:nSTAND1 domain-containing NTPase n=1 Tax=Cyanophyceae TaxID=3028117 RepID=UPI001686819B|nr:CHAT domain-containing protein [Coleofasciculus sp. FACHB-T130]MBD1877302.1 CHAT domain-containing protein [Coleofasciculus sp. FACHB-T130]
MNVFEFEITIQSKSGDSSWPIVVRCKQPDGLTIHSKETLELSQDDFNELTQQQENEREYGTLLGKALFRGAVYDTFVRALSKSSQDCRLRILLSIEAADNDEVKTLHWERLCAPIDADEDWDLLARDQRVPFSLYIPTVIDRRFPPIGRRDLRALVLVASPSNIGKFQLAPFDVEAVLSGVKEALGDIPYEILANDVAGAIGPPTLQELSKQLTNSKKPYTLLHFVAHGKLMDNGETVLYWAKADNQVQPVTGEELLSELKNIGNHQRSLPHFAFLCTCESADPRAEAGLGGLGQRLVRNLGMPAVVAMTRKVSVETGLALGQSFYRRLRESGEVDTALQEATAGLGKRHDIAVPALFSRLGGRPLFSDRLDDRDLTDEEIDYGIGKLSQLLQERAPHASVLKESFKRQVETLNGTKGAESRIASEQRQQAIVEIDNLCDQVLEISFDALAALGKEPPEYKAECPFPGLSSFAEEQYHKFFFGRDELIRDLQKELAKDNFLAVIGASGSGKSSVVLAGLIPKLKQEPSLQSVRITPSNEPLKQLEILLKVSQQHSVLVVDQFEELFTLCEDKANRQEFIDKLLHLASRRKVVITMRADFLGECTFYPELRKRIETRQKLVGPMEPAELITAMKMQADRGGLRFETGLSHSILNDVQGEPGAMPLLQYALQELWKRRRGRWMCDEEYQSIGRVHQAIAKTADDFYNSLPAKQQEQVQNIFLRLTRLDKNAIQGEKRRDTRQRVELEDLVPSGSNLAQTKKLVQQLAGEGVRLVVTSRNQTTGKEEVEVAHEALIRYWPTLKEWLSQNRSDLQLRETICQAAEDWHQHQKQPDQDSYLIHQGGRLEDAQVLLKQPKFVHLNQEEAEYVLACLERRDRIRRQEKQRRHRLLFAAVSSAFVFAGFAIFAAYQWRQADSATQEAKNAKQQTESAKQQTEIERIQALSTSSEAQLATNQLETLIGSLQAAKGVKKLGLSQTTLTNKVLTNKVIGSLQKVTSEVRERNRLEGHTDSVIDVSFSPNGQMLASTGDDGTVRLSDLHGNELFKSEVSKERVRSVKFSPKGQILATGAEDGIIKLWDFNGKLLTNFSKTKFPKQKKGVYNITFSPDGKKIAAGSGDGIVLLWSLEGNSLITFPAHNTNSKVWGISFSPDGEKIATSSGDGTAKLWDLNGTLLKEFKGHKNTVFSVNFSPDGQKLATAAMDGTAKLWDLNGKDLKGKELRALSGHEDWVFSVIFSPDGKHLATGSKDGVVRYWGLNGKLLKEFKGHKNSVRSVVFRPDGKLLATAGYDNTVRLWDLQDHQQSTDLKGHEGTVWSVSFSPDDEILATAGADGTVRLWDYLSGEQLGEFKGHKGVIWKVTFSPKGKLLATSGEDKTARLWSVFGKERRQFQGHEDEVLGLNFSPDGKFLATSGKDDTARLWDLSVKKELRKFKGHIGDVLSVSFSPKGKLLATAGKDGMVLATAGVDGMVRLWNSSGQEIEKFQAHPEPITSVIWSNDGQKLATGSGDGTIRLWDLSGKQLKEFKGHIGPVQKLRWSKDDKLLATAGSDSTARLWDVSGPQVAVFKGHKGEVKSIDFSLDGKLLATSGQDGTVKLWRIEGLDELMVRGCAWVHDYLNNQDSKLTLKERQVCHGISSANNPPKPN